MRKAPSWIVLMLLPATLFLTTCSYSAEPIPQRNPPAAISLNNALPENVTVVDTRHLTDWLEEQVVDSINLPAEDPNFAEKLADLPESGEYVFIVEPNQWESKVRETLKQSGSKIVIIDSFDEIITNYGLETQTK